ncbi:DNA repair protein RadC [Hujiaoplasma nucleasis]|uniref:DNA repair protein RadC n=1 Tax=Hujiaoplasma nucleasis TaxID=2725268 RepID=A0A7L6N080_9MOLU|nr:DNA repair protein RadC [Hujiaoplasma nucleasis]QLY39643.1 DNA repair protein RadC [Hujiaoplasma nucleasis]
MYMIKDMPKFERPREKVRKYGVTSLNTYELLAIILRAGTHEESAIDISRKVIRELSSLGELREKTIDELTSIKGIGQTKAITILSALELGKRVLENKRDKIQITCPETVFDLLNYDLKDLKQEVLIALYLDLKTNLIAKKEIFRGSLNQSLVHPREIFKYAVKYSAYQLILVHNHPSGDPYPSKHDIELTNIIEKAGQMMQIYLLDHIIIGDQNYLSINAHQKKRKSY